ncbi:MAG: hypothetical protein U0V75_01090 [Ferruginibacter sp.]
MRRFLPFLLVVFGLPATGFSQDNSPYSRYGLGDLAPNHNVFTRGMGGISAGVFDYLGNLQGMNSNNFANPAALANVTNTIFDIGAEASFRTLKSLNPVKKFTAANSYFNYLSLAFPIASEKMKKKDINWGLSFGLKPITRISYKIENNKRLSSIDSLNTLYEGSGGTNLAYVGTAFRIKGFSLGINAGYMFGNKDYSTRLAFINDTVAYAKSNTQSQTNFGGLFLSGGLQYEIVLNKNMKDQLPKILRFGLYGNLQQKLNANRDNLTETFSYDGNGLPYRVDSVYDQKNIKGKIEYPSSFTGGFSYQDNHWIFGADFETTNWSKYRYYGQADPLQNKWTIRVGGQYYPAKQGASVKKYFNFVRYRAGFYYGPDYIKLNNSRPDFAFTVGTGMPLTSLQRINWYGEYVMLNTALEIGGRGNKTNNVKENMVRFSIGIAMNGRWFRKIKYD